MIKNVFKIWVIILVISFFFAFNLKAATENPNQTQLGDITSKVNPIVANLNSINETLKKLTDKEDWASWAAVVVALLLGLAGIFSIQDWVREKIRKPIMKVRIKLEPPDSLRIALTNSLTGQFVNFTYYFRFKVENTGNYHMEDVEVMAVELERRGRNNRYVKVNSFLPMNMKWADIGQLTISKIQPGLFKYCDFGHIIESAHFNLQQFGITATPQVIFILDTQVTPNTGSNILLPGEYRIKFIFSANNIKPQPIWFRLNFRDQWTTDERQMLSNNISIEKLGA